MKKWNKIIALILALCMVFTFAACGETEEPSDPVDTDTDVSEPVEGPDSIAGTYRFDYVDPYGDVSSFTVTLKDGGSFNILTTGAMGNGVYSGNEWTDNGDGTFTTGAADPALDVEWVGEDGSATWTIDGSNVTPVNYTEPTEFLEKSAVKDPVTAAECVGVYTFVEYNSERGSSTPWVVWVNADGTYHYWRDNAFLGLRGFTGTWTYAGDGVVDFSVPVFDEEGKEPVGDFVAADYSTSWTLYGDGTCVPVGYTETIVAFDAGALSTAELLPEGYEYIGVYTFGEYNSERGSTTPWVVWLNADGSYHYWRDNAFLGLRGFTGTWTYEGDGTFNFGVPTFDEEGKEPVGDFVAADYSTSWIFGIDGSCVPVGYTETAVAVDTGSLSDPALILEG